MTQPVREIPTLTVAAAARRIGVSDDTVRDWADKGLLRCFKLPGSGYRRFFEDDVDRFIAEHTNDEAAS